MALRRESEGGAAVSMQNIWPLLIVAGAGTFLLRLSFLALMDGEKIPDIVRRALNLVPAAVLAALCLPAFVPHGALNIDPDVWARPGAALIAILVAWRFGNMLLTLGAGMAALWALQALL